MIPKPIQSRTNLDDKVDEYRQKMINLIANSEEIFHLIADDDQVFGEDDLVWTNIYPTEFIAETQETAQTFVCVDIDVESQEYTNVFDCMTVYFFISTHVNTMRHPDGKGLRVDAIAHEIRKMIDRQFVDKLGANRCSFLYNHRYNPNMVFRGRVLCMQFKDFKTGV